jgi:hypothetical protein
LNPGGLPTHPFTIYKNAGKDFSETRGEEKWKSMLVDRATPEIQSIFRLLAEK